MLSQTGKILWASIRNADLFLVLKRTSVVAFLAGFFGQWNLAHPHAV